MCCRSEQMEEENIQATTASPLTVLGIIGCILAILALLFMMLIDYQDETGIFVLVGVMCFTLLITVVGLIADAKKRSRNRENQDALFADLSPRKLALLESKRAFLEAYPAAAKIDTEIVEVKEYDRVVNESCHVDVFEEQPELNQKLLKIQQLQQEIRELEKKRVIPVILMTVFGILIVPLFVGSILLGNVNAKLNQKRFQLQEMKDDWLQP